MIIRTLLILPLVFILATASAQAQNVSGCSNEDMSAELGEVRSQGNIGWCYANTVADLLSFKFRKQWNGRQASAIFTALGYNFKQNSNEPGNYIFTEGGDIKYAIGYAKEFGYACPRQLDNIFINGGSDLEIRQKLFLAEKLKGLYVRRTLSPADLKIYRDYVQELRAKQSVLTFISDESLERALGFNLNFAVIEIAKEICRPYQMPMSLSKEQIHRNYVERDNHYYFDPVQKKNVLLYPNTMPTLDAQLSAKNVVGIDYQINLISTDLKDDGGHASVVVGRRLMPNGQCLYKIRNSWGASCDDTVNGVVHNRYNSKVVKCEDGHVWVSRENLIKSLIGIAYIDQ